MGIRPFVAIRQEVDTTSSNTAESTMKGILVGPSLQSEREFKTSLNVSSQYGNLTSILADAAVAPKTIIVGGLNTGATVIDGTIGFGVDNGYSRLDFATDYKAAIKAVGEKHILKVDLTTANAITIAALLSIGAEAGDRLDVGVDDAGTVTYETHKIRKFEVVDNAGTDELYIHLWDEVGNAADDTVELLLVEFKQLKNAKVSVLAPMVVTGGTATYTIDNTASAEDGAFTATFWVYSPIGSPDGVTFENRQISTTELLTLSNFTKGKAITKVVSGNLYNFFDANRSDLSNNIFEVTESNYISKLGAPTRSNKLSYAMSLICKEVPGASMKVYVTEDETYAGYKKALDAIATSSTAYSVSVLTDDSTVLDEVVKMVELAGSESIAKWKMGIVSPRTPHFDKTISLENGYSIAAGAESGTFNITSTIGGFLATGVKIGDYLFTKDGLTMASDEYYSNYGETYSDKAVGKVLSIVTDKKIIVSPVVTGADLVVLLSAKVAVLGRINKFSTLSTSVRTKTKAINNKDVVSIFPDKFEIIVNGKEEIVPSFFVSATLNGVMAHLPPQQGLSNLSLPTINRVIGSSFVFTDGELDEIAADGSLVLLQEDNSSDPYILRQITTNVKSLEEMEINKVRCLDYATIAFANGIQGYIGKRNVSEENASDLKDELKKVGRELVNTTSVPHLGSIITSFDILNVIIPDGEKDAINAEIDVVTPTSLNKIRLFVSSAK